MAEVVKSGDFPSQTPNEAFEACLESIQEMGFEIWKTRPVGGLIIANGKEGMDGIQATITIRPGTGAAVNVSLRSTSVDEGQLVAIADRLLDSLAPSS